MHLLFLRLIDCLTKTDAAVQSTATAGGLLGSLLGSWALRLWGFWAFVLLGSWDILGSWAFGHLDFWTFRLLDS
jgi:hypothetical protein